MKAFSIDRYGSGARLRAGEVPDPVMREDDVLVQIHAAGVNLLDSKIRNGEFKLLLPYRPPLVLGHDVAGVVTRVGLRVRRFKPGDEVYARPTEDASVRSPNASRSRNRTSRSSPKPSPWKKRRPSPSLA